MKIYFAGPIRAIYHQSIQSLQGYGPVLAEHVGDPDLTQWGDDSPQLIYQRDMAGLDEASLMLAG